ncbi:MAG: ABC transporter ATP-binding protein [Bacillota bacterium]|nr:ABC transporter ATP-binding protein [Bacillota bacterium]HQD19066.1 ABC transporter ATP-binding protein [Bacillota bacterium]
MAVEVGTGRNADTVIETFELSKSFGSVHAVRSLSLKVKRNSIYAFLGPNGAGKSTTIKMLLGLTRPSSGSGRVLGMDIETDSVKIRQRVGYLAQDPRFYPNMTVRETLMYVSRFFYSGPKRALEARVDEMLDLVGLYDLKDRRVGVLSGGERQRHRSYHEQGRTSRPSTH